MEILFKESASRGPGSPKVVGFYEPDTGSCQYICIDEETRQAALIDIVQEFDPASATTKFDHAQWALDYLAKEELELVWILDTHPHADHLMAAAWLKEQTGKPMAIGEKVKEIAELWRDIYHMPVSFDADRDFDRLFADGDTFKLGNLEARVMLSPGHTLGSITYVIGDAMFAHDTFMQPDAGTARADFPGGSAAEVYDSLMAILDHPDDFRIFIGHDYGTADREEPAWESTVKEQREGNIHIGGGVSKGEYVERREKRDATLGLPDRMLAALQINLHGGRHPQAESDGHNYLKIPMNKFKD
ncbi:MULTISPECIES: MBL fold metallo-hydrolase [Sulfitobacter]|jgi:glyoxylase-like metal-dependent hydrolase (beta-lactamase superfamily II)|uniref:MBL fold metallo-hydrolase n=1 Tax=Sulfitobacter TaxID=60136 RepID=UPI000E9EA018|nr:MULTISPECIES: MBL fold metallo-hydrolase [Sulfitobacter]HAR83531.1 MBL fold metallo-hydrolase [Sulfitobacter pontiacus]HBR40510.1 MBL fold metallo-hydrolase [Sulfitobacter pontiacus]|tara:strand:- start:1719 stop:2624 length:906 start_codon:yes stop_codon:yes gene_type:complete